MKRLIIEWGDKAPSIHFLSILNCLGTAQRRHHEMRSHQLIKILTADTCRYE